VSFGDVDRIAAGNSVNVTETQSPLDVDSLVVYKRMYVQRCTSKHQADTDVTIALLGSEVGDAGIFLSNVSHP